MRLARILLMSLVALSTFCFLDASCLSGAEAVDPHQAAGDGHASPGAGDPNPLAVDPDLAIWTGVVFALLLYLLSKFAWPVISEALLEREQRIENNIAEAEAKNEQAKQMLTQHEAKLAAAADEVRELLEEARRDAEHTKAQILAEAKQAADQERDRAVRDVERAADHAMKNLAETSANLAVDLAGKVVRQNITPKQQADLVKEALSSLAATNPSEN
ncbi:MAG: F0F1 ATP synthase subunit B [Pirellulales bacterium]|nr:F0F1 ATP synthase subunit B [Pirellulales bacterium]